MVEQGWKRKKGHQEMTKTKRALKDTLLKKGWSGMIAPKLFRTGQTHKIYLNNQEEKHKKVCQSSFLWKSTIVWHFSMSAHKTGQYSYFSFCIKSTSHYQCP